MKDFSDTYEILEKLGEGAGGIVYKAYHRRLRQEVVIKRYRKGVISLSGNRREADILKNLRHSYLPQVLDFFETDEDVCTVMSYVPGKTFARLLEEGRRFTSRELARWGMQICSALNYLHSQEPPVIHCDIKPANVMLTPQGDICLIDFNISFYLGDTSVLGYTNGYTSPEQYLIALSRESGRGTPEEVKIDERTDIYSVGATLYHLAVGQKVGDYRERIDTGLLSGVTGEAFAQVIEKALRVDPGQRWQSAYDMFRALQDIPKKDRRYLSLLHRQTAVRTLLAALLAGCILLTGYGISEIKRERMDSYNSLVEEQIRLIENNDFEEQEKVFEEASGLIPSSLESYYQNAYALYKQERYEDCIAFVDYDICENEKLDLAQARMADVYYLRADSYFRLEQYEDAADAYEDVFRMGTRHTAYYRDYAIALAYAGEEEEAQDVLQEAIDYGLKEDSIYYAKGEIENALGKPDAALQEFGQCISISDDNEMKARAYLMMDSIYEEKGSGTSQRDILLKAKEDLPAEEQMQILEHLAAVDIELADTTGKAEYREEAVETLVQIIGQGWGTFTTFDTLAVQYQKQGDLEQAQKTADQMLKDYGEDYRIYMRYAFLEIDVQGLRENASRDYTKFAGYCEKAEELYQQQVKDNNTDEEMQLLEEVYRQVEEGGWLE
ncbi:MAG TPA: protein kinase [Candidatus Mediterraneibacter avicola]|nr:protein kinase [Candidatus Mediterraneibacter avicola]